MLDFTEFYSTSWFHFAGAGERDETTGGRTCRGRLAESSLIRTNIASITIPSQFSGQPRSADRKSRYVKETEMMFLPLRVGSLLYGFLSSDGLYRFFLEFEWTLIFPSQRSCACLS